MLICKICGHQSKRVLTKHIKRVHGMSREEYQSIYPESLVVDPECSARGREIASFMHTDEVKHSAHLGRLNYWENINEEEKNIRIKSMIESKRTDSERLAQRERMKELRKEIETLEKYENYREQRKIRMCNMVTEKWKDPEFKELVSNTMSHREVTDKERETRRENMIALNNRIYSDKGYRDSVCSPLWGLGKSRGIRTTYISRSGREFSLRSLWELNVAIRLDDENIGWDYESLVIDLPENHHYIPDFYIPELNLILEVKPTEYIDEYTELKRVCAESQGFRFIYVTENELDSVSWISLTSLCYTSDGVVLYKEDLQRLSKGSFFIELSRVGTK